MKTKLYAIHDAAAQYYLAPFNAVNDATAQRVFTNFVRDNMSEIAKHPADFTLFAIGEYDDQVPTLTQIAPVNLGNGLNFKEGK